jgi:protoporphyrinogen oxidase
MVDPFVSGVYAGDPHQLSVQSTLGKVSKLSMGSYVECITYRHYVALG